MPQLRLEFHLGRFIWILGREDDINLEYSSLIRGILWTLDIPFPVPEIPIEEAHPNGRFL
jgi:hypothetical protein